MIETQPDVHRGLVAAALQKIKSGLSMDPLMQMQWRYESFVTGIQPDVHKGIVAAALQ